MAPAEPERPEGSSSSSRHRSHRREDDGDRHRDKDRKRDKDQHRDHDKRHRARPGEGEEKDRDRSHSHRHRSSHGNSSSRRSRSRSAERGSKDAERSERKRRRHGDENDDRHRSSQQRRRDGAREDRSPRRSDHRDQGRPQVIDDDDAAGRVDLAKNVDRTTANGGRAPPEDMIPTSESLSLTSHPVPSREPNPAPLPGPSATQTKLQRDDWMLSDPQSGKSALTSQPGSDAPGEKNAAREDDFFASMGMDSTNRKLRRQQKEFEKPDPEKLQISSRELNTQLVEGKTVDQYAEQPRERPQYGAPGHQWRMMKLRRVYEAAQEEGRPVEQVALERYANLEEFNEARAERQYLDDRDRTKGKGKGPGRTGDGQGSTPSGRGTPMQNVTRRSFMFSDSPGPASGLGGGPSRPSSRQSFRRPGEASMPSTPMASTPAPLARGSSFLRSGHDTPGGSSDTSTKPSTPIPNVFTPVIPKPAAARATDDSAAAEAGVSTDGVRQAMQQSQARDGAAKPLLNANELNKLQAKAMRAELMGAADAQALKDEYERESARSRSGGDRGQGFLSTGGGSGDAAVRPIATDEHGGEATEIAVLPTLDGQGRLYDVGTGAPGDEDPNEHTRAARRRKDKFETRDSKTGERLRYNADDDSVTLADLVRQERFGGGSKDQKNVDAELASHIMNDSRYQNDEDYIDDNSERLARKKMKSDAMKRQFAIQDFAKTKKALDTCLYCWQDEGARPPRAPVVSSGTRVYLSLPEYESLTPGHCLIVPMQHHLSTLEADDDTWDEIKNFMKCLMQAAAKRDEAVVFYETVLSLKHQKHTAIEAVSVPREMLDVLPGIFKESLMMVEDEWSTNAKVIDFSKKGFRRSLVPQLPYFMVQWDYRGDKGFGHVIERTEGAIVDHDGDRGHNAFDVDEGGRTGGDFPRWFAAEIIGNQLELEPRRWRKPRRLDKREAERRLAHFRKWWDEVD